MPHALLSASGAERWFNCTPSARLEEGFPGKTSSYAEEGTLAHSIAELTNRYNFKIGGLTKAVFNKELKKLKAHELYNPEMDEYMKDFCGYIHEKFFEAKAHTVDTLIDFEQRLDFSKYVPEGFGTGDVVIISDGALNIIDLKYGKGVPVYAEENKQMMLYALGAYDLYAMLYDIDMIYMAIHQPRLDNISVWSITVEDLLKWAETELKEKAALAFDGAGDFTPGDHCRFCKAKATCRARAEENLKLQKYEYINPDLLTDDEISDILLIAERLKNWADDVSEYALDEALQGKKFKGFKLVEGRSNRKYADDDILAKTLIENNYTEDEIYNKKLLGLTDMEKLLTKKTFQELIGSQIIKPQGKPTLVVETDKRPEFNSAALDFKNIDIGDLPF